VQLRRTTTSVVGNAIVGDVKNFILDNARAMEEEAFNRKGNVNVTVEDGAKALSHAIAYGIAKALSSGQVELAFKAGICPPGGDPVPVSTSTGKRMFSILNANSKEQR